MHIHNNRFSWLFLVLVSLILSAPVPSVHAEGRLAAPPPSGSAAAHGIAYTVKANDTLWDIATRYGITVAQLTAANPDVNPDALRPGQTLTIPSKASPASAAPSGALYHVKPNDTLWNIATKYGIFVNDLLAANPGVDPQRLMAEQILIIPGVGAKAVQASQTTPATNAKYTVRPDDTLWGIAANFGMSLGDLLAANPGVDARRLMVGQTLTIPGISQEVLSVVQPGNQPAANDAGAAPVPVNEQPPADPAPADAPPAQPAAPAPPPAAPTDINPMAQDMLNRINEKRAGGGLPALAWNPQLAAAAQAHADDCANRNRGSHVGSDGARLTTRLERVGYPYQWHGENWANARDAARAMDMWWNEPRGADPHVRNIMASRATEVGIGIARGAWGWYFITDFGSR